MLTHSIYSLYSTGLKGTQYGSLCILSGSFHILQSFFHIPEFACIFCRALSSLCMAFAENIVRAIHIILWGLHSVGLFSDYEWLLLRENMARAIHKFLRESLKKSPHQSTYSVEQFNIWLLLYSMGGAMKIAPIEYYVRHFDRKKSPPPGGFPIYYVPSSTTVCKRTPLEEQGAYPSRGVLLHTVLDGEK